MQTWKCMVRMPSNFIQNIEVEAYTYDDAVAIAESSTGGECLNAAAQWRAAFSDDSDDSSSDGGIDGGAILALLAVAFLVAAWKYILIIGGISLVIWLVIKYSQE